MNLSAIDSFSKEELHKQLGENGHYEYSWSKARTVL